MNALSSHNTEAQRLAEIRASLASIAPGDFHLAHDGETFFVESIGEMGEVVRMLTFEAAATDAERDFIVAAPDTVRFLMHLVDRALEAFKALRRDQDEGQTRQPESKDYAAEAAMKCAESRFKRFLMDEHGLESPATLERTAQRVRTLCGVTSRKEFNDDADAAERWKSLRKAFDDWRKRERV